jgi:hypothetical protein
MPPDDDFLTIGKCPKCPKAHRYELNVKRSLIMFEINISSTYSPTKKYFTRLFTCPTTGQDYQARFWIMEAPHAPIESLEVKGLAEEAPDE